MANEQPKVGVNTGNSRPKGVPNKINALLKDEILQAAANAHPDGRVGYLTQQANENPVAFMTLVGKVLPTQIDGEAGITIFMHPMAKSL